MLGYLKKRKNLNRTIFFKTKRTLKVNNELPKELEGGFYFDR
jgi:hypothetical protein